MPVKHIPFPLPEKYTMQTPRASIDAVFVGGHGFLCNITTVGYHKIIWNMLAILKIRHVEIGCFVEKLLNGFF